MNVVDTIMAGRLSPDDLAAIAIGWSGSLPFFVLSMGILTAINPIIAQLIGANKTDSVGKHLRQTLWFSQLFAVITYFILQNLEPVLALLDVSENIIPLAMKYIRAISYGIFPVYAFMSLRFFNEGMSVTKPAMYITFTGLIANIGLNYVLMYGKLGFPVMGAEGCGYATSIVWTIMFFGMVIFVTRYETYKKYRLFEELRWPEWLYFRELIQLGVPIGISSTMEVSMFALVSLVMGSIGTQAVAAHQIAINVASILFMIPFGLSTAITARVGLAKGADSWQEVLYRGKVGIGITVILMFFTAALLAIFPDFITRIYTEDTAVQQMAAGLLLMAALFQLSDGLQVSGFGALRGLKDTRIPMFVNILAYWIIGFPLGYYLGIMAGVGPVGLWIGLIAGLSVAALLHNLRFYYLTKRGLAGT